MGEVYRARDTRLGRDVAIKVLPPAFAADPHRLARFEREACLLAALNHPNIATIHGVDDSDGGHALVMELVGGDTLAERIRRRSLSEPEAVRVAHQIAEPLRTAHERGIVHRDLKPANIKITPDGVVKVLDFGLAKPLSGLSASEETASLLAAELTQDAGVVGTAAYMSPEQARGEPVDARTDVWAFGCVLYEMLTGRPSFPGGSTPEILAAVIGRDPDWSQLPAGLSSPVRTLLQRCLARDRRDRVPDMNVVLFVLDEARALAGPVSAPVVPSPARRGRTLAAIGIAALLAAGAGVAFTWLVARPLPPRVIRTTIEPATIMSGSDPNIALTPDGRRLAYISADARQILIRPLDALDPVPILTTAAFIKGVYPSPDGQWLAFIENNFTLKKIPVGGGSPLTVRLMDGPSRGAAWGPDSTIVFATGAPGVGLQQVSADGGDVTVLTRPRADAHETLHCAPHWLPGGRGILFTIYYASGASEAMSVAVLDMATGTWRTVLRGGAAARYVPSGHLVYFAAGALWAVRFDLSRLETTGAPIEVVPGVNFGSTGAAVDFDVAADGTLVYLQAPSGLASERLPVWVDRDGRETPLAAPLDNYLLPRLSPDGRRLALVTAGDIYIWELGRPWSTASRLTFLPDLDWFPVWTPDGQRIVFGSWRGKGLSNLYVQRVDGGVAERLSDRPGEMQLPTSIAPDGATVIFHSFTRSLQALPLRSPGELRTLVETPLEERNGEISPDGRWMAYEGESASVAGELDVYVRPFPLIDAGLAQVTKGGGLFPVWARNGRELFYVRLDGTVNAVKVEATGGSWRSGDSIPLFRGSYFIRHGSLGRQYDVASDGRFLMLKVSSAESARFVVVQNWGSELAQRVP